MHNSYARYFSPMGGGGGISEMNTMKEIFLDRLWKKTFVIRFLYVFFFRFISYRLTRSFREFPILSFVNYLIIIGIVVTRFTQKSKHWNTATFQMDFNPRRSLQRCNPRDRRSLTSVVNYITANDVRRESSAWNSNR